MEKIKLFLANTYLDANIRVKIAYREVKRYLLNIVKAFLGIVNNEYRRHAEFLTEQLLYLLAENQKLRKEVDRLTEKTSKKTATVAKSKKK